MQSSYSEYSYAYAMVWLLNDTKMRALFLHYFYKFQEMK